MYVLCPVSVYTKLWTPAGAISHFLTVSLLPYGPISVKVLHLKHCFSKMSLFALQPWIVSLCISFRLLQLKLCVVRTSRGCGLGCHLEFVLLTLLVFWNWISIVTFRMFVLAFSCDFLLIQDIYFCLLDRSNEHGFPVKVGCISCFYDPSC